MASLVTTFVAYIGVGLTGYAALGDATPGNILTGFTSPPGLVTAANAMVLVHMVRRRPRDCVAVCAGAAAARRFGTAWLRVPKPCRGAERLIAPPLPFAALGPRVPGVQPAGVPHD